MEEEEKKGAEPRAKPEWTERVKDSIKNRFDMTNEKLEAFCKVLRDHGALIAGGFVLQAVAPEASRNDWNDIEYRHGDLDIYVSIKKTQAFIETLFKPAMLGVPIKYQEILASVYCRSFLRRNGIRSIKTYRISDSNFDIMSVRNHRTPTEVVSNFDLTFCQVWFDGEMVFATHPEHIESRSGFLQNDYVETYVTGNRFLYHRMNKYISRGFRIEFDHIPDTATIIDEAISMSLTNKVGKQKKCRPEQSPEKTIEHAVRRSLINMMYLQKNHGDVIQYLFAIPYFLWRGYSRSDDENLKWSSTGQRNIRFPSFFVIHLGGNIRKSILPYEGYDSDDEEDIKAYQTHLGLEGSDKKHQKDISYLYVNTFTDLDDRLDAVRDITNMEISELEDKLYEIIGSYKPPTLFMVYQKLVVLLRELREEDKYDTETMVRIAAEWKKRYDVWQEVILRRLPQGEDMFGRKGPLLLFHDHDEKQGITPESLKEYVKKNEKNQNKCFVSGCEKELTIIERKSVTNPNPFAALVDQPADQEGGTRKNRLNPLKHTFRRYSKGYSGGVRFPVSLKRSK